MAEFDWKRELGELEALVDGIAWRVCGGMPLEGYCHRVDRLIAQCDLVKEALVGLKEKEDEVHS